MCRRLRARFWDGLSVGTNATRHRSRRPTSGMWRCLARRTTSDAPPRHETDYCLNVGITWSGLVALEVTDRLPRFSHGTFNAFVEGAAKRAEALGDRGASGPRRPGSVDLAPATTM